MFTFFIAPLVALSLVLPAYAQPAVELDGNALKAAVRERVSMILTANGKGEAVRNFTVNDITIKASQKVDVQGLSLYAVKLGLKNPERLDVATQDEMTLLVDASGTVQFNGVNRIATGEDVGMGKATDITRLELPQGISQVLAKGTGTHNVTFVSDSFCPYCRTAYGHLMDRMNSVSELRLVHMPLPIHPGADMASWVMNYALGNAQELGINPAEVVKFAYTKLNAPETQDIEAAQKSVLVQMVSAFPGLTKTVNQDELLYLLKGKYSPLQEKHTQALTRLRITGTPAVIIDGQPVMGFNAPEIDRLLGEKK